MDSTEKIKNYLLRSSEADLSEAETGAVMDSILSLGTWESIRDGLLNILYSNDNTFWKEAILYIYFFQNRGFPFEAAKTIALLYNCLALCETLDENLIWTITIYIKGISYLSEYEPYQDAEILNEMARIERMRKSS